MTDERTLDELRSRTSVPARGFSMIYVRPLREAFSMTRIEIVEPTDRLRLDHVVVGRMRLCDDGSLTPLRTLLAIDGTLQKNMRGVNLFPGVPMIVQLSNGTASDVDVTVSAIGLLASHWC